MLFVLMISTKGGYKFHSIHKDKVTAEQWEKCKQADGDDTAILTLEKVAVDTLKETLEIA